MKLLVFCLLSVCILYSQKEISCDGFSEFVDGKYIITYSITNNKPEGLGVIDIEGNQLLSNSIKNTEIVGTANIISDDVAIGLDLKENTKIAFDLLTKKVIASNFYYFSGFKDGICLLRFLPKVSRVNPHAIDKNNNNLFDIPVKSDYLGKFNDGIALVGSDTQFSYKPKYKYINKKGTVIIDGGYRKYDEFHEGLAAVGKLVGSGISYGFIDKTGNEVIEFKFSYKPSAFSEGKSVVMTKDGKYGFIDNTGSIIIEPQYKYATGFYENRALVNKDYKKWALIDDKNNVIKEYSFSSIARGSKDKSSQQIKNIKKFMDYGLLLVDDPGYLSGDGLLQLDGNYLFTDKTDWTPKDYTDELIIISTPADKIFGPVKTFIVNREGEKVFTPETNRF